jgi:hypothetical protein
MMWLLILLWSGEGSWESQRRRDSEYHREIYRVASGGRVSAHRESTEVAEIQRRYRLASGGRVKKR